MHLSFEPRTLTVEASDEAIANLGLDIFEDEQFDRIHDVIAVDDDGSETTFTTARTLERPDRFTLTIPNSALQKIHGLPGGEC